MSQRFPTITMRQNPARAFHEAERSNQVLMIGEADSLFLNRQTATRSWEISETNEILAQMELFKGVFICTTNLLETLKSSNAIFRR